MTEDIKAVISGICVYFINSPIQSAEPIGDGHIPAKASDLLKKPYLKLLTFFIRR